MMSPIGDNMQALKPVCFHKRARDAIRAFSKETRIELGSALMKLQLGMTLSLPLSRPMPSLTIGAQELRFRDASGVQRVFYYARSPDAILVFHAFVKKAGKTPIAEISMGRRRLQEMLANEAP